MTASPSPQSAVDESSPLAPASRGRLLILVLPAYNEAENLTPLVAQARSVFQGMGVPYRIIVVDDGSTDATPAVLHQLAAESPSHAPLKVVTHSPNRGLGAAIVSGLRAALAEIPSDAPDAAQQAVVICMDADDTHDPSYVPSMAGQVWAGMADVVIASRFRDGSSEVGVPFGRRLLSRGARVLFQLMLRLPNVRDYTCGYRAYRASLLREAAAKYGDRLITRQGFACTDELLVKLSTLTRSISEVPFVLRYDKKRSRSKLPLFRTIYETLKMLLLKH